VFAEIDPEQYEKANSNAFASSLVEFLI